MTRRAIIAVSIAAGLSAGVAADAAAAPRVHYLHPELHAARKKKAKPPVITSVSPLTANVGDKLTITGKNLAGKRVKVFFLRSSGGVVIATAESASKGRVVVTVPSGVTRLLTRSGSGYSATAFKLRVLTSRFSKVTKASAMIGAAASGGGSTSTPTTVAAPVTTTTGGGGTTTTPGGGGGGTTPTPPPAAPCTISGPADSDGDGLTNALEINTLHTDPCLKDTDGDSVEDGYEYQSAIDMNNTTPFGVADAALPSPSRKPWPNPLDPSDAGVDHDGDGLSLWQEQTLNSYASGPDFGVLVYSDGKQSTVTTPAPVNPIFDYMDHTQSPLFQKGVLSDDERDADSDGLTNWDECCGRMTQNWWDQEYSGQGGGVKETRYPNTFTGVSMTNPDTDGDGVLDGADDQDHDGLSNAFETSRPWDWGATYVSAVPKHLSTLIHNGPDSAEYQANGGPIPDGVGPNPWARVQPFNPCKPVWSKTCHLYWPFGYYQDNEDWAGPDPSSLGSAPSAPWMYDALDIHKANGE